MTERDKWHVVDHQPEKDSLMQHSRSDGSLEPYRALLHELVTQMVTERKVIASPEMDYAECLYKIASYIRQTDGYNALVAGGVHDRKSVADLLDTLEIERLPEVPKKDHETVMVLGGPGSGKSAILRRLIDQNWDAYSNAAVIDPDNFRYILFTADGSDQGHKLQDHGAITQKEIKMLMNGILNRVSEKLEQGHCPNIVVDTVFPWGDRLDALKNSSKVWAYIASAPIEECLDRTFNRAKSGLLRSVDTSYLIRANRGISQMTPELFTLNNIEFQLYDTSGACGVKIRKIADYDSKDGTLHVHDKNAFYDFTRRQHCQMAARSEKELYAGCPGKKEVLHRAVETYRAKGVEIVFDEIPAKDPSLDDAAKQKKTTPGFGRSQLS